MAAELTQLEQELQEIRHRAEQLVAGLTPEQLTRRPDPAKWSIAECLAHLNLTAEFVQPKIAAAIEQGHDPRGIETRDNRATSKPALQACQKTGTETPLTAYFAASGAEVVRSRLASLSESHLESQLSLLRVILAMSCLKM